MFLWAVQQRWQFRSRRKPFTSPIPGKITPSCRIVSPVLFQTLTLQGCAAEQQLARHPDHRELLHTQDTTTVCRCDGVRPIPMETRSSKKKIKHIAFKEQPKIFSYRRCGKKGKKMFDFFSFFSEQLQGAQFVFFWLQIVNTLMETGSCDDRRSIST